MTTTSGSAAARWPSLDIASEPFLFQVVFGAPALRRPGAPAQTQALVAQLRLEPALPEEGIL